jgi:hypothetical protein
VGFLADYQKRGSFRLWANFLSGAKELNDFIAF